MGTAVAYYRTSSAANVGPDKDSVIRQRKAVQQFAKSHKLAVGRGFVDPGVPDAAKRVGVSANSDELPSRPLLIEMPTYSSSHLPTTGWTLRASYRHTSSMSISELPSYGPGDVQSGDWIKYRSGYYGSGRLAEVHALGTDECSGPYAVTTEGNVLFTRTLEIRRRALNVLVFPKADFG